MICYYSTELTKKGLAIWVKKKKKWYHEISFVYQWISIYVYYNIHQITISVYRHHAFLQ